MFVEPTKFYTAEKNMSTGGWLYVEEIVRRWKVYKHLVTHSNSDPHTTDMGRVGPKPAFVHYSSNPLRPSLVSKLHP